MSLADKMTAAGIDVTLVESGLNRPDQQHQALNKVEGSLLPVERGLGFAGRRAVGGTTHVWGGVCPRFDLSDFRSKSDFGYGVDWPISYAQLSPYYCEAERWLRVSDVQCARSPQSPYVNSSRKLIDELAGIGLKGGVAANMSVNRRGLMAPYNLELFASSNLVFRKNFRLITDHTVRRVDIDQKATVRGVNCTSFDGKNLYIGAKRVVLCCGAIQNARLLLLSANSSFPDGIGNSNGQVGAYFMDHPNVQYWVKPKRPLIDQKDLASFVHSYALYRQMKSQGLGATLLRFGAYCRDWQERLSYKYLPESRGATRADQTLLIEGLCEQEPLSSNRLALARKGVDRFGDPLAHLEFKQSPRDRQTVDQTINRIKHLADELGDGYSRLPTRLSSHHLMGTTRIGKSAKDSVVDDNLKVHATKNLYLAGGSVFATGGAANPTLTLTALSLRLADQLIDSYKNA